MTMLAERIDAVIGVDTHKASHTAAVVTPTGGATAHLTVPSDAVGAKRVLAFARRRAPDRRVWAIEGTGQLRCRAHDLSASSRASGSSRSTAPDDPPVATAPRATSSTRSALPARRSSARAPRPATATWRPRGPARAARDARGCGGRADAGGLRAPGARGQRTRGPPRPVARATWAPTRWSSAVRGYALVPRSQVPRAARDDRGPALHGSAGSPPARPRRPIWSRPSRLIVQQERPELLAEPGVGVITAAAILERLVPCRPYPLRGRIRDAGGRGAHPRLVGPDRATSVLNRAGDRQLNRALHTIVLFETSPTIRRPGPMPRVAERRAGATGRSSAVSSASSHGGSSGSSRTAPKRLDRHRSIRAASATSGPSREGAGLFLVSVMVRGAATNQTITRPRPDHPPRSTPRARCPCPTMTATSSRVSA